MAGGNTSQLSSGPPPQGLATWAPTNGQQFVVTAPQSAPVFPVVTTSSSSSKKIMRGLQVAALVLDFAHGAIGLVEKMDAIGAPNIEPTSIELIDASRQNTISPTIIIENCNGCIIGGEVTGSSAEAGGMSVDGKGE